MSVGLTAPKFISKLSEMKLNEMKLGGIKLGKMKSGGKRISERLSDVKIGSVDMYSDFDFEKDSNIVTGEELRKPERILSDIREVALQIEIAEAKFDSTENEDLTEAVIYELKALNAKYRYLIKLARESNIKSADIGALYAPVSKFSA